MKGEIMRTKYAGWVVLLAIAALAVLAAKYYTYFPGDVVVERWVQSLFGQNPGWAKVVSWAAGFPWVWLIVAFVFAVCWFLAGWRAALVSILSFMVMLVLGDWLQPVIARPRPSPELVNVFRPLSGYSFPSISALRYASTFGFLAVLALKKSHGVLRAVLLLVCTTLLILCFLARVVLAAHWPSDVIISYYIALLCAVLLIQCIPKS